MKLRRIRIAWSSKPRVHCSPPLQGSRAPPWWLSHFLVSERVLFGTWDGVFTSCLINIFGVIVFLRSGWIVAEAGIASSSLIVLGKFAET